MVEPWGRCFFQMKEGRKPDRCVLGFIGSDQHMSAFQASWLVLGLETQGLLRGTQGWII